MCLRIYERKRKHIKPVMNSVAAISPAEVGAVQSGVMLDVREDGRTLVQRRPVSIHVGARGSFHLGNTGGSVSNHTAPASPSASSQAGGGAVVVVDGAELYDGNAVSLTVSETTVLATASPSVVAVPVHECSMDRDDDDANQGGDGDHTSSGNKHATGAVAEASGEGVLAISIDVVPSVVDLYAQALGGNSRRYRRVYLDHLAHVIRQVFGAQYVTTQEVSGVAEADVLHSDSDDDDAGADAGDAHASALGDVHNGSDNAKAVGSNGESGSGLQVGFPSKDLYIGKGFAFRVDVDVHVLQAMSGNLLSQISMAVHCALRTLKLPAVTLHETAAGVSVEMDRTQPYQVKKPMDWSQLPLLTTLLLSPTRHYVVDPTLREELAMPQQLHVAATAAGQVCFVQYQTLPSRRGHALHSSTQRAPVLTRDGGEAHEASRKRERGRAEADAEAGGLAVTKADQETIPASAPASTHTSELYVSDWLHSLSDAVHICQAMVSECGDMILPSNQAL